MNIGIITFKRSFDGQAPGFVVDHPPVGGQEPVAEGGELLVRDLHVPLPNLDSLIKPLDI